MTAARPVSTVRLSYLQAFGGTQSHAGPGQPPRRWADPRNPLGLGYVPPEWDRLLRPTELSAPQVEVFKRPYGGEADYPVVGFGAVGRAWLPRRHLAGTYDEAWKQHGWPALPKDHDYRYWNCAPEDQQLAYPSGGETIRLVGLGAPGAFDFVLPRRRTALRVRLHTGPILTIPMNLDTLEVNVDEGTLCCVYRRSVTANADVRKLELGTWETNDGN